MKIHIGAGGVNGLMKNHTVDLTLMDKGLIYTDTHDCIGCNNCIRECPTLESNVAVLEDGGKCKIHLDDKECVLCGTCLDTCTHNVRLFRDDCDEFFDGLKNKKKISVLIAPAFWLNYPDEYKQILGYLKSMGVNKFYNVGFGADITTWAYLNYIQINNALGKISQPCPAIVSYIEKQQPDLLPRLIPIQSPMMAAAIYLKKYLLVDDELAFLSPCIAKKIEMDSERGLGLIKYNVTFVNFMKHIKGEAVDLKKYSDTLGANEEVDYGLGALYPAPGGLRENVEFYMGEDALVIQAEGEHHAYEYLKELNKETDRLQVVPTLVDILNCARGCNYGTGTEFRHTNNNYIIAETHKMRREKRAVSRAANPNPAENFAKLNERFKELKLNDFTCVYDRKFVNKQKAYKHHIEEAYEVMLKTEEAHKIIDCRACGYKSCYEMAKAMVLGLNQPENCVEYVKERLKEQMAYQQTVIGHFSEISTLMLQLNTDSIRISADATGINERVEDTTVYSSAMRKTLQEVLEEFERITDSYNAIVGIASKTNILSINAKIEAARSGNASGGFAVIAGEMSELSKTIMAAADKSKADSAAVLDTLGKLTQNTGDFTAVVDDVKISTRDIRDSVGNISAKLGNIMNLVDTLNAEVENKNI